MDLTFWNADQDDDGTVTVRWKKGDLVVSLVCRPNGNLIRLATAPNGFQMAPVTVNVLDLAEHDDA